MKRSDNYIAANAESPFSAEHILLQKFKRRATQFAHRVITIAFFVLFDGQFNFLKLFLRDHGDVTDNSFLLLSKKTLAVQKLLLTDHTCNGEALQPLVKLIHNNLYSAGRPQGVDKIVM